MLDALLGTVAVTVPGKLYFTAGATEAANWALKGSGARAAGSSPSPPNMPACSTRSSGWPGRGVEVEILPVGRDGLVDLDRVEAAVTDGTGLVAAMLVNNEIGVIQPVAEIAAIAHAKGALVLLRRRPGLRPRAAAARSAATGRDLRAQDPRPEGHRRALGPRRARRSSRFLHGGGQEGGVRSGHAFAGALRAGFGAAARACSGQRIDDHVERLWTIARELMRRLDAQRLGRRSAITAISTSAATASTPPA